MDEIGVLDIVLALVVAGFLFLVIRYFSSQKGKKSEPPRVPNFLPYFGSFVGFAKNPVGFIIENSKKYGDVFTATILGKEMTFLNHPKILETFFKATDNELSLRDVYKFMRPVFGAGVVYDADSTERMMEQVKFVSSGLTTARFRVFVDIFEDEVRRRVDVLGKEGTVNIVELLSDLIIFTASRCLLGDEVREYLSSKNLGKLYHDIDEGISPLSFFYPSLPAGRRDTARKAIGEIFQELLDKRREEHKKNPERLLDESKMDVVDHLLTQKYKDGQELTDVHRIGVLIAGLFAGQHTSSITSSWTLMSVIADKRVLGKVRAEQDEIMGSDAKLDYEKVMKMDYLEACMKEALRMYPPLIMIMRMARKPRQCEEFIIPKGNILVVSPSVAGRCTDTFTSPDVFRPERLTEDKEQDKFKYGNVPFGAGRHKCIGENFALLQVKSIISILLRYYDMEYMGNIPEPSYSSLVVGPAPPNMVKYKLRK
ncbi:obtusifoliol 14alpha-demethylase [Naegleria gruberi]|uniref:Obtusifoliol 14alpha-demethylase n=1 Tax=Naegleria gruberi TaxID=5762 RepID=D2V2Q1_NAEGR|nr:obtusifoliol 14alpha-demethylase [Naegleria gruberi]EFC48934.1 obtusifoliol 14alpha-demethylase [Naegleria gruberi]|eukprot:XP_002681678.1 obtusifoliol 14alpha-demethylase [Naegleria gruberi strain NEG-M]